jgi:hypothetical protein
MTRGFSRLHSSKRTSSGGKSFGPLENESDFHNQETTMADNPASELSEYERKILYAALGVGIRVVRRPAITGPET